MSIHCEKKLDIQNEFWIANRQAKADVVQALLLQGADPDLPEPNDEGVFPVHRAASHGDNRCLKVLLAAGVDVSVLDNEGLCVLHHACWDFMAALGEDSKVEVGLQAPLHLLISLFDNLDLLGCGGNTPLHFAARSNYLEGVLILTAHGANIGIRDNEGLSPLDIAKKEGYSDIVNVLTALTEQQNLRQAVFPATKVSRLNIL